MNNANRYPEAIRYYQQYLEQAPHLGLYRNPLKEAEVCRKLAHAYSTQGQYKSAEDYLRLALAKDSSQRDNTLNLVEDYRQMGMVNAFQGDYFAAREYLMRALETGEGMASSIRDIQKTSFADTELALGQVCLTTGDFETCGIRTRSALELYRRTAGEEVGTLEALLILGILERERGQLDQAIKLIGESRDLAVKSGLNTVRQDQAIAEAYFQRGDWEEGLRQYLNALKQAELVRIKPQVVMANIRVGDAYQRLGDDKTARQYYDKAFRLQQEMQEDTAAMSPTLKMRLGSVNQAYEEFSRSGSQAGAAVAALRVAEMLIAREKFDSADLMLGKARSYFAAVGSREGTARTEFLAGKNLAGWGRPKEAMQKFRYARRASSQADMAWRCWFEQGRVQEQMAMPDSARYAYRQSISIIESVRGGLSLDEFKSTFSATSAAVYDQSIRLLLRRRDQWKTLSADSAMREAFDLGERARSRTFLDMLGNRRIHPKSTADQALMEEEQHVRLKIRQLSKELAQSNREPAYLVKVSAELQDLEERHISLLQQLKLGNPAYSGMIPVAPASLREIQRMLDDKTLLLEYWVSPEFLVVWAVEKKSLQVYITPVTESQLHREVSLARRYIAAQVEREGTTSMKFLYTQLLKPVAQKLASPRNLVIIPHKGLHFLPFQALMDPAGKYVAETQPSISIAPSASVWLSCLRKEMDQGQKFLGLALGNTAIEGYPGLPGTSVELGHLAQVYPDLTSCSEAKFTETYFKTNVDAYNYVHVATHGVLNSRQPMYSYVLMTPNESDDGHLSVHEILDLSVQCKLLTLSACETGLGQLSNGDELVGLSRAFMYSGAPAVVVSLWKVDDATTSMLMARFYQYLAAGQVAADALNLAQRDLLSRSFAEPKASRGKPVSIDPAVLSELQNRNKSIGRLPYYWAAFQIIGNGRVR